MIKLSEDILSIYIIFIEDFRRYINLKEGVYTESRSIVKNISQSLAIRRDVGLLGFPASVSTEVKTAEVHAEI